MKKKIIFLDIDGTLTEPGCNEPPASALQAIRRTQEKGNLVFLCTGRNYDMLSPLLPYGFDGVIASSGAYIRCGEEVIYDCTMTDKEQETVMKLLKENGIFRTVECLDGSYTDEGFKEFLRENAGVNGNSELLRWRRQIEKSLNIRPMSEYGGQPIYKIVMMVQSEEQLSEPRRVLGDKFDFCIQEHDRSGFVNGELIKKDYNKGTALKKVCAYYDVSVEDSIAYGDSMNDLEMMEAAGISVCMENGSGKLKELADDICPSVQDDGIYRSFEKHMLL
ncbi:MAG: HAD family phosphatase [Lachnospiraceae bacterium]|nr:HAD family phosphatase [Lachnospiraceae bacterium]